MALSSQPLASTPVGASAATSGPSLLQQLVAADALLTKWPKATLLHPRARTRALRQVEALVSKLAPRLATPAGLTLPERVGLYKLRATLLMQAGARHATADDHAVFGFVNRELLRADDHIVRSLRGTPVTAELVTLLEAMHAGNTAGRFRADIYEVTEHARDLLFGQSPAVQQRAGAAFSLPPPKPAPFAEMQKRLPPPAFEQLTTAPLFVSEGNKAALLAAQKPVYRAILAAFLNDDPAAAAYLAHHPVYRTTTLTIDGKAYAVTDTQRMGGYGKVRFAMEILPASATPYLSAVKVLRLGEKQFGKPTQGTDVVAAKKEIDTMHAVDAPTRPLQTWVDGRTNKAYLVMAYQQGEVGRLFAQLPARAEVMLPVALQLLESVAGTLQALHRGGKMYADLKKGNILYDDHGNQHLADFGLVQELNADGVQDSHRVLGTLSTLAPEALIGKPFVGAAADVWSLGVTLVECITQNHFVPKKVTAKGVRAVYEELINYSASLQDPNSHYSILARSIGERVGIEFAMSLFGDMLNPDPQKRPTPADLLVRTQVLDSKNEAGQTLREVAQEATKKIAEGHRTQQRALGYVLRAHVAAAEKIPPST